MNYFVQPVGKRDWGYTITDDAGKVRDAVTGFTSGESAIRAAKGAIQRKVTRYHIGDGKFDKLECDTVKEGRDADVPKHDLG